MSYEISNNIWYYSNICKLYVDTSTGYSLEEINALSNNETICDQSLANRWVRSVGSSTFLAFR